MHDPMPSNRQILAKVKKFAFPSVSLHQQVEEAAYFLAEHRGFAPGHELDDWLEAERAICQDLSDAY